EQGQVGLDAAAQQGVGDVGGDGGALALGLDVAGGRGQVGLSAGGGGVGRKGGAPGGPGPPGAGAGRAGGGRARGGGGGRGGGALEEPGVGFRVLAVAFGLAAMQGGHGPGVAEDEGDGVIAAGVGEPVPAMHTLAGDEEPVSEGSDGAEEGVGVGGQVFGEADLAVVVEDDEEEGPGVEIDAGIESGVGGRLEGTHEKASGLTCGGGGWVPSPSSHMRAFMSIQSLRQTGHANDGPTKLERNQPSGATHAGLSCRGLLTT